MFFTVEQVNQQKKDVHSHPPFYWGRGVWLKLPPNFQKEGWGDLTGSQFAEGVAGRGRIIFLRGDWYIENKLKSEIFND